MAQPSDTKDWELAKFGYANTKAYVNVMNLGQLIPQQFDYISLGYTGTNLTTVVYKLGGVGGTTVATLTLAYTGDVLNSVTKT